jgi:hypothetical protein
VGLDELRGEILSLFASSGAIATETNSNYKGAAAPADNRGSKAISWHHARVAEGQAGLLLPEECGLESANPLGDDHALSAGYGPAAGFHGWALDYRDADRGSLRRSNAAVTKYLASPEIRILALLAPGVQPRAHLQALRHVCRLDEIRVWSRTRITPSVLPSCTAQ